MKYYIITVVLIAFTLIVNAQPNRWQQQVNYTIDVNFNVNTNQYTGNQKLVYTNNSPDTLKQLFYHLYFNAFQPGSSMDMRSQRQGTIGVGSRNTPDWDARVTNRIANLKPNEIGYQKIKTLTVNGVAQPFSVSETILQVTLTKPILPKTSVTILMNFEAQVPLQVRRSGRDNPRTGVRYSMSQWYPKLCEYDYEGWHPTPYVAREFYGIWGNYQVNITIDKNYMLGGTGNLLNPNQIGMGYQADGIKPPRPSGNTLTWQFNAPMVHDFVWAASPNYTHDKVKMPNGTELHVLYTTDNETSAYNYNALPDSVKAKYGYNNSNYYDANIAAWKKVLPAAQKVLPYIEKTFGAYPYKQYSFIQGGDGGMEYPMATLIATASLGTVLHEWMHTWYQMLLATNEGQYAWMDEGFTEWASNLVSEYYQNGDVALYNNGVPINNHIDNYKGYYNLVKSGLEEPLTTHADQFNTNYAYSNAAYNKGCVFLEQLGYIIGGPQRDSLMLNYYNQWRYKHPNPVDFLVLAQKQTGLQLQWYRNFFVNTTKTIDYKIDSLWQTGNTTKIRISRIGQMPMPIDVLLTTKDGKRELHNIPLNLMYGAKPAEYIGLPNKIYTPWQWTVPTYTIETNLPLGSITIVEIDPSQRLSDVERKNNKLELTW